MINSSIKSWFAVFFVALLLSLFAHYRTDGFSLSKIQGRLLEKPSDSCSAYREIFNQPFSYLSRGEQCFVFASNDGSYVLKFINYSRFTIPSWMNYIPLPHYWKIWLINFEDKKRILFDATMKSMQLAFDQLCDETGMKLLHLGKGGDLPTVQIIDQAHRTFWIDLNQMAFILQKRAVPIYDYLDAQWRREGITGLEKGIDAFTEFLHKRCLKGIADADGEERINYGFEKDQLLLMDFGRLYFEPEMNEPDHLVKELKYSSKRFRKWLSIHYPNVIHYFDSKLQEKSL